jgi:DNA polymerase-3 subunit delta'
MNVIEHVNESVLGRFHRLLNNHRLAHAYLFIGPAGVGKFETARTVAKMLNCENRKPVMFSRPCDECVVCRKIDNGNHPDVHILQTAYGETIKIEMIRELTARIQFRPYESQKNILIIRNIENFTTEAANALLKTLEEPPPSSLMLLTTSVVERNLDTVRSRCHTVYFYPMGPTALTERLKRDAGLDHVSARLLSYFSGGSMGQAMQLADKKFFKKRNEIIDRFVFGGDTTKYIKDISSDKESTKMTLDVLLSWFRDLILIKTGIHESFLINFDRLKDLMRIAPGYAFDELKDIIGEIVRTTKLLNDNLNVKIALSLIKEKASQSK